MKWIKPIFLFILFSLILLMVTQMPLVMSYLDEQRLLKQVKVETIDLENQNFQKSKLDVNEKIELLYNYYKGDGLYGKIVMASQQRNTSNYDCSEIENKIKEQVEKLQNLNIFPIVNFDNFTIKQLITTKYSQASNPECYVSFLDVLLSDGKDNVQFLVDQDNNLIYQFSYKSNNKMKSISEKKGAEIFGLEYLGISKKTIEKFYYCKSTEDVLMMRIY